MGSKFWTLLLICTLALSITALGDPPDPKQGWSKGISVKDKEYIFKKISQAAEKAKSENRFISVAILNGKFLRGKVTEILPDSFKIIDYKQNTIPISFDQIKVSSLTKLVSPENQKDSYLLHIFGILFFYEPQLDQAKNYFEKAIAQGYKPSQEWLEKVKKSIEEEKEKREKELASKKEADEKEKEEANKKVEENKAKEEAKNFKKVIDIREGGNEIDLQKLLVQGKYTILEFYAEW